MASGERAWDVLLVRSLIASIPTEGYPGQMPASFSWCALSPVMLVEGFLRDLRRSLELLKSDEHARRDKTLACLVDRCTEWLEGRSFYNLMDLACRAGSANLSGRDADRLHEAITGAHDLLNVSIRNMVGSGTLEGYQVLLNAVIEIPCALSKSLTKLLESYCTSPSALLCSSEGAHSCEATQDLPPNGLSYAA